MPVPITNVADKLPPASRERLVKAGIDLTNYPEWPPKPKSLTLAAQVRDEERVHNERGKNADPEKKALLGAAKEVIHLSKHIGTEIVGLQLSQLTDQQKDELALLIAERTVVFFRDQDLSPQQQRDLGAYFGEIEVHPTAARVPGLPGVSIIWPELAKENISFRNPFGTQNWHTDLTHEKQPPGITHLHNDTIPSVGGDTYWASGYSAYDKLSPAFRAKIDGLQAVYRSAHSYKNPEDPDGPLVPIERVHPLVRTHPATGWKSLFVNRVFTLRIVGFEPAESKFILDYLFDVYERSLDIQVRFKWTPRTSALWDNRISIHAAVFDYEGHEPRHGTRVSSLAEVPYFDPQSKSRREALGLDKPEDFLPKKEIVY
ncbi:alpha-ketoglutarate-dependent taurine dioxygenase [Punctularia strigosozonata HHB-11173 SS5]|uniref:alpha-ketoglutarate-dependent taurine dioxygenase n=1 Tax=Punctularia strigosozonata (strain HHB-11173) TaxID=741275 RepID=UPI000441747E|nr:alpha-ketoglutarate-dependent taurine dioxygenase [Punctularia strigosozonata HHB-11173 SS5]EIN08818.1 alpha-ketoglutarate-dependent taurine dioxygenase [Punctularia strigosozonata HHB-11173 SS5]